jgi:NAD(P)H dehydrogenase (quinone)
VTLVTVVTVGPGELVGQAAEAVARGARNYGNRATVHLLDRAEGDLPAGLPEDLRNCVGLAIGSSLSPKDTVTRLVSLYEQTGAASDPNRLGIRVATTFTTLDKADPASAEAVDRMNRLLYRWGAVIVSPGYSEPVVDWLDNRPGVETQLTEDTSLTAASVSAAERQGRRLGRLAEIVGKDLEGDARLRL